MPEIGPVHKLFIVKRSPLHHRVISNVCHSPLTQSLAGGGGEASHLRSYPGKPLPSVIRYIFVDRFVFNKVSKISILQTQIQNLENQINGE